MSIGLTIPFSKSTGSLGYFQATDDELSAAGENVKSLLLTNWGERPMRYSMGCNFREFLFEPLRDEELRNRIADRIGSQLSTWLPYVVMDELNVLFASED